VDKHEEIVQMEHVLFTEGNGKDKVGFLIWIPLPWWLLYHGNISMICKREGERESTNTTPLLNSQIKEYIVAPLIKIERH